MSDLNTFLAEAGRQLEDLQTELTRRTSEVMQSALSLFFNSHPEVKTIYWSQYLPGFNDGDACEFSMNEINFSPMDASTINGPYHDDEYDEDDHDEEDAEFAPCFEQAGWRATDKTPLQADMEAVTKFIESNEEYMQRSYGDNAFVKVHRLGVDVGDYDCGH